MPPANSLDATLTVIELIEHPRSPLKMAERFALLLLAGRVNHSRGDWRVWPSLDKLATGMHASKDTTRRALRGLTEAGLLSLVRIGNGRGNPTVYQLERVALCNLLRELKGSQTARERVATEAHLKSNTKVQVQHEVQDGLASANALAELWNGIVTRPIPKVRIPLSPDRVRAYARAWPSMKPDEWRLTFEHVNGESWCRAPGVGEHPNWTETLDRIVSKPGIWQRHFEKATSGAGGAVVPRSRAEAYRHTQASNAAAVAGLPAFFVGGRNDEAED